MTPTPKRAWRQLAATVPHADTPAQTAGLRLALQSLLLDTDFHRDKEEEVYVRARLEEVGWSEGTRVVLEAIVARWKHRRGIRGEQETQPPPHPDSLERMETMSTVAQPLTEDNGMSTDVRLDLENLTLLHQIADAMRKEGPPDSPNWGESGKLTKAIAVCEQGRIRRCEGQPDVWEIQGSKDTWYLFDNVGCSCDSGQKGKRTKYGCYHSVATVLQERYEVALANRTHPQEVLFAAPKTAEERIAAMPADTAQDAPGSTITTEDDLPDLETPLEAPESPETRIYEETPEVLAPVTTTAVALRGPLALFAEDLETWGAQRDMIMGFIRERLKPDVDYGPVHFVKNCAAYKERFQTGTTCTKKYHWSKDSLRKPGAEKVTTLLRLRPEFVRDHEIWEMLGSRPGVLCLRCLLISPSGEVVGEGRAARDVEKQDDGDINKAIKMCEKSAHLDAVIRVAAISDVFTQLEDDIGESEPPQRGPDMTRPKTLTDDQLKENIRKELARLGEPAGQRRVEELTELTFEPRNYDAILKKLRRIQPVTKA